MSNLSKNIEHTHQEIPAPNEQGNQGACLHPDGKEPNQETVKAEEKLETLITLFDQLLNAQKIPEFPQIFTDNANIEMLYVRMIHLREIVQAFSVGNLSQDIIARGFTAGCLKGLQAHLRHFVWQVQQVEKGDLTQRVDFLGEFSTYFNHMIEQLDSTMKALKEKEEALLSLTRDLQEEVELRKAAMNALTQSEAQFRYLAEHDPLTNCLNRRSFFGNTTQAIQSAARSRKPCCIALLDIDYFKRINDTYGHLVGTKLCSMW